MARTISREAAKQTFRQFAWNLAGTIAKDGRAASRPVRPATKTGGKR